MSDIEQIKLLYNNNNRKWGHILYTRYLKGSKGSHLLLIKEQIFNETGISLSTFNLANKRAYYNKKERTKTKDLAEVDAVPRVKPPLLEIQNKATAIASSGILSNAITLPDDF